MKKVNDNRKQSSDFMDLLQTLDNNIKRVETLKRGNQLDGNRLERISEMLSDQKFYSDEFHIPQTYNTVELFEKAPKTIKQLLSIIGQKRWKTRVCLLGSLCEYFKRVTSLTKNRIYICQTSKSLLSIYKHQNTINRVIKLGVKIGLLFCIDDKYRYKGSKSVCEKWCYSKKYIWNKEVQQLIEDCVDQYHFNDLVKKQIDGYDRNCIEDEIDEEDITIDYNGNDVVADGKCEEVEIGLNGSSTVVDETNVERIEVVKTQEEIDEWGEDFVVAHYNVDISAGLQIGHCSDEEAKAIIYAKYPQILHYQKLADEMNKSLDIDNKVVFKLKVHRSAKGYITKISIRAFTKISDLPNKDKAIDNGKYDPNEMYIQDYVDNYMVERGIDRTSRAYYDINGTVYRLSYLKSKHEWFEGDIYELLFGDKFESKEQRNLYKHLFSMRGMFDWSSKSVYHKLKGSLKKEYGIENIFARFDKKHEDKTVFDEDGNQITYSEQLIGLFRDRLQKVVNNRRKSTSVFLDESCIMMDVCARLRKMGYTVIVIYDGLYVGAKNAFVNPDAIDRLVRKCAFDYMNTYYWNGEYEFDLKSSKIYSHSITQTSLGLSVSISTTLLNELDCVGGFGSKLPYTSLENVNLTVPESYYSVDMGDEWFAHPESTGGTDVG